MTSSRTDASPTPARRPSSAAGHPRPGRGRSGRRPGDSGTREQILSSALHLFADRGYARTTIRAIAEDAGVDPALVHHFFVNKEGVFEAAVNSSLSVSSVFDSISETWPDDHVPDAEWFARSYLRFWEDEKTRYAMIAIYRTGLADSANSETLRTRVEASAAAWTGHSALRDHPEALARVAMAAGHLIGPAILRYVLKLQPLASMDFDEFLAWVIPTVKTHLSPSPDPSETTTADEAG
ncbi:transcriptional regulator, TetR family [Actinobacteria bacterium OK074]|nr:transcriptional regulator, TetR family [Actinobacteria bacterium OK074]